MVYNPTNGTQFVGMDGNGNVIGMGDRASSAWTSRYEYGPFGEPIRGSGALAKSNPFRFSTKFTDNESGLVYYGYRYYSEELGRWMSRDPIFDIQGQHPEYLPEGANVYSMAGNNSIQWIDGFGLSIKQPYTLAFEGFMHQDPYGEWAAFTSNVFRSRQWRKAIDAGVKYFDSDGNKFLDDCDLPPFRIRVVGYSWGGWSVVRFIQIIGNKVQDPATQLKIAAGTLDPVDTGRLGKASIPVWVKYGKNIYQTNGCYKGCFGPSSLFVGRSVGFENEHNVSGLQHGFAGYKPNEQNYDHNTIRVYARDIASDVNKANLN